VSHTIRIGRVLSTLALAGLLSTGLQAQTDKPEAPSTVKAQAPTGETAPDKALTQLQVQITIARYAGEKKTTSLPFTLWVTADGSPSMLNAGQRVLTPQGPQDIGTSINCRASAAGTNRFRLNLFMKDAYLSPAQAGEPVILKSLETNNWLFLRDGQTAEFIASTDMVTGEVTRIEVTANVLK
jgi:hypothetical protein